MRTNHQPYFGLVLIRIVVGLTVFVVGWGWWGDASFDPRTLEITLRADIKHHNTLKT